MSERAKENVKLANALYNHLTSSGEMPVELSRRVSIALADVVTSSEAVRESVQQLLQNSLAGTASPRSSAVLASIEAYLFTDVLERALQLREVWEELYDHVCRLEDEHGLNRGLEEEKHK